MNKIAKYLGLLLSLAFCLPAGAALRIGWAEADITPPGPVSLAGSFGARISERVCDPITATVLVLESGSEHVIWVSCDLIAIADELRDAVRAQVASLPGLDAKRVILNATHTHSAPELRPRSSYKGIELPVMKQDDVRQFITQRIVTAVEQAWRSRAPGGFSYGLSYAVVGRNRRTVDREGRATMYGEVTKPGFSHIEGFEDHMVNILTTYDAGGELTGMVVNFACPVQAEYLREVSADFLHETRGELRRRVGKKIFVAAQISAAGDIAPHLDRLSSYDQKPFRRMIALQQAESGQSLPLGKGVRQEIARRLANATEDILPLLAKNIDRDPLMKYQRAVLELPMSRLTEADATDARKQMELWRARYESEKKKLEALPELPKQGNWYASVTHAYGSMRRHQRVMDRYQEQQAAPKHPTQTIEIHAVRLGEMAFVSNPFEYYVDYGIQIKGRSPATQTFLVQLAGSGTYVPSLRSVKGGGYGSEPASNPIGHEGGAMLCERTLELLQALW